MGLSIQRMDGCAPGPSEKMKREDFPGGTVGKNPPVNAGDTGSVREDPVSLFGLGRSHKLWNN